MVWLIRSTFNLYWSELPKSLCTFFWTLVSAIVLQPFCWFQTVMNLFSKDDLDDGLPIGLSLVLSVIVICFSIASMVAGNFPLHIEYSGVLSLLVAYGVGILCLLAVVAVVLTIIGITEGAKWILRKSSNIKQRMFPKESYEEKEKTPSIFWEFIKAKKRKICPIIEYKGN